MNPSEYVCRFGISFTYVIESIESKLISVSLINDYWLIADLHIFVYGRAEFFITDGTKNLSTNYYS